MKFRKNGAELGAALSLVSVALTWSATSFAQSTDASLDFQGGATASETEQAASAEADASAPATEVEEPTAELETPAPEPEPVAEPEVKEPEVKAEAKVAPASADKEKKEDPSVTQTILDVIELPGTAYPSVQVRGIKYGSLWRTFHGMQWPYIPQTADKPSLRIGLSGYIWNDLSNTRIDADPSLSDANVNDQNRWVTQTRGVLRVTPTLNMKNGWFAQGNAELVVQGDMQPDPSSKVLATTDDVWVRFGKWDVFDVTVGRFQAWEIANHLGMALDWATLERSGAWVVTASIPKPTDGYGLTYFWDRQNFLLGTYALHVYPTKWLRGELLGHVGAGNSSNAANPYQVDIRPSAIFDIGFLKIKAGYEYGKATPQDKKQVVRDTKNGFGAAAQVVLAPYVEFGGSFARGYQDILDKEGDADLQASNTVQSVGGFLNFSPFHEPLVIGVGAFLNQYKNMRLDNSEGPHKGKVDTNEQWLMYGAVQYTLWERLYLKMVVSHASNKVDDFKAGNYVNNALSARLRTEFLF